jgi:hypothetical protein
MVACLAILAAVCLLLCICRLRPVRRTVVLVLPLAAASGPSPTAVAALNPKPTTMQRRLQKWTQWNI